MANGRERATLLALACAVLIQAIGTVAFAQEPAASPQPQGSADDAIFPINTPGITKPTVAFKVEPEYSEEARQARYQGTVVLYVEVDKLGHPRNIKVKRTLGLGLDEKAVQAVEHWRFRPGMKDGQPVVVAATIEVNFRLLDKPRQPGGGPEVVHKVEPKYSKEARKARLEGAVLLAVDVGGDGKPNGIRLVRGLGMGLDEQAIKAVRKWKFKPGTKEGKPVPMTATVEVHFRLEE